MRIFLVVSTLLLLCGCEMIYKLPTRQGNALDQKQLDQLQNGMTRDQVRYVLGTPIAASPFRTDRWDYVGYYRSPRGKVFNRTVSLYFGADNKLERMEGIKVADADKALATPDVDAVIREDKKDKLEIERRESEGSMPSPTDPSQPEPSQLPNP